MDFLILSETEKQEINDQKARKEKERKKRIKLARKDRELKKAIKEFEKERRRKQNENEESKPRPSQHATVPRPRIIFNEKTHPFFTVHNYDEDIEFDNHEKMMYDWKDTNLSMQVLHEQFEQILETMDALGGYVHKRLVKKMKIILLDAKKTMSEHNMLMDNIYVREKIDKEKGVEPSNLSFKHDNNNIDWNFAVPPIDPKGKAQKPVPPSSKKGGKRTYVHVNENHVERIVGGTCGDTLTQIWKQPSQKKSKQ